MTFKMDYNIHNRYDVEVRDAKTGELKQTAVGYNVVLDSYFSSVLTKYRYDYCGNLCNYISFGSGTGTPAITDTTLFNKIADINATEVETVYSYPTSHRTVRIVLGADSYNGYTLTEVGLSCHLTEFSGIKPWSHAMLQDSEGQQIAIPKTNTDVVTITATVYATYASGGFGSNGIYPAAASSNVLVKWLLGKDWTEYSRDNNDYFYLYAWHHPLTSSEKLYTYYTCRQYYEVYSHGGTYCHTGIGVFDVANKTLTLPNMAFLTDAGGTQSIKTIGIPNIGAFVFPDSSVMSGYAITGRTLGTGDGTTTDFNMGVPSIKTGSVHVYVDGVEQAENTDFTVDYAANDTDNYGNYHTACLSPYYHPTQLVFGDAASRSATTRSGYYDPTCVVPSMGASNRLPEYCYVSAANPIWMDFLTAKECNKMKIHSLTIPAAQVDNMVIEYSSDNTTWTAVTYTRSEQVYTWPVVSARYWRVYISGYSWYYSFQRSSTSTLDGIGGIGATFFFGKSMPALHFLSAPAADTAITASYEIDVPYKTSNNIIRMTVVIQIGRGDDA